MAQCDVWRKKLLTELIIKKRFDPCLYHNSHNTKCQIQGPFFVVQKSAKLEQNYQNGVEVGRQITGKVDKLKTAARFDPIRKTPWERAAGKPLLSVTLTLLLLTD